MDGPSLARDPAFASKKTSIYWIPGHVQSVEALESQSGMHARRQQSHGHALWLSLMIDMIGKVTRRCLLEAKKRLFMNCMSVAYPAFLIKSSQSRYFCRAN